MNGDLVSIGIPTYNRPEGLKKALDSILRQTYKNIEVIISDNYSSDPKSTLVANEYALKDKRIKYYRQFENFGPGFNLHFLHNRLSSNYFMWLCDDDYIISDNLIEELMNHAPSNILTFSDHKTSLSDNDNCSHIYGNCQSKLDYLYAWLGNGGGAPIYGLYNRKLMNEFNLNFSFDADLDYYNEGTMLHKLFLTGKVKFVPYVYMYFDRSSTKPSLFKLCMSFIEYYDRTVNIMVNSNLNDDVKKKTLEIIHQHNSPYFFGLFCSLNQVEQQQIFFKVLEKGFIRI